MWTVYIYRASIGPLMPAKIHNTKNTRQTFQPVLWVHAHRKSKSHSVFVNWKPKSFVPLLKKEMP